MCIRDRFTTNHQLDWHFYLFTELKDYLNKMCIRDRICNITILHTYGYAYSRAVHGCLQMQLALSQLIFSVFYKKYKEFSSLIDNKVMFTTFDKITFIKITEYHPFRKLVDIFENKLLELEKIHITSKLWSPIIKWHRYFRILLLLNQWMIGN